MPNRPAAPTSEGSALQQQHRLKKNRQFSYVYNRGARVSARDLALLYVRNTQKRAGFSVSKKVGCAVVRNRVKRRLRECVRHRLPQMRNGLYVIVAYPSAAERTFQQLQASVDTLLRKLPEADAQRPRTRRT